MKKHNGIRPQDIVILAKIAIQKDDSWYIKDIANELFISNSEVSESLERSVYSGLLSNTKKRLMKGAFLDYLVYGLKYTFPQKPKSIQRGMLTAYSAPPIAELIENKEKIVWAYADGKDRGMTIEPLHPNVPKACEKDKELHEILSLIEVFRVGNVREVKLATEEMKKRLK